MFFKKEVKSLFYEILILEARAKLLQQMAEMYDTFLPILVATFSTSGNLSIRILAVFCVVAIVVVRLLPHPEDLRK
jgi:hypothetical protein